MRVKVLPRQTLSDIAIQVYGDLRGLEALMDANGISATDDLQPGSELECPDRAYDSYMQRYVTVEKISPATAIIE